MPFFGWEYPFAFRTVLYKFPLFIITIIANRRGLTDAAAVGIVEKIIGFMFLVPSSHAVGRVGACGAKFRSQKPERAKQTLKYAIAISTGIGFCAAVAVQFAAEPVVSLFTSDLAVIRAGGQYFRGYVWDSCIGGIQFSFSGYFCACGRSELSFLHNIISIVFVRIPGAFLASKLFADTLLPMGFASTAGSLVSTIVCLIAFAIITKNGADPTVRARKKAAA